MTDNLCPYLSIPFKFSDRALAELRAIVDPAYSDFEHRVGQDSGNRSALTATQRQQNDIHRSLIGQECSEQLAPYRLDRPWYQIFLYRPFKRVPGWGNPHLDSVSRNQMASFRFNVLIEGDPKHPLAWWTGMECDHPLVKLTDLQHPDGSPLYRYEVLGNTVEKRLKTIGEPTITARNITVPQVSGAFVKTDVVHSLFMAGEKRILFSLRYTQHWSDVWRRPIY